jgi:hypothetical protein
MVDPSTVVNGTVSRRLTTSMLENRPVNTGTRNPEPVTLNA